MRTTLTLEDDVAKLVGEIATKENLSFKETVNRVMRAGLTVLGRRGKRTPRGRYRVRPVSLGEPRFASLDDVAEIIAVAEGEERS